MQELFVDKIHFFKFLCMSDKPRLHQLNIITSSRSRYKLPWLPEYFHSYGEIPSRKGKYPMLRTNTKPHQLIKHAKISYSIVSLLFHKFSYRTYRNGLNQVPQSWGTTSISKSTNRVSSIPFVGNPHFSILLHRVQYLKNRTRSVRCRVTLIYSFCGKWVISRDNSRKTYFLEPKLKIKRILE